MHSRSRIAPRAGRLLVAVLLAGGALATGGSSLAGTFAAGAPSLFASVDGVGRWYDLTPTTPTLAGDAEWSITTDHFDFSVGVDQLTASHYFAAWVENDLPDTRQYSYELTMPFVRIDGPSVIEAGLDGEFTDTRGDGLEFGPIDGETAIWKSLLGDGPDYTEVFELGPGFSAPPIRGDSGVEYLYGPFSYGPTPGPAGSWNRMRAQLDFTVSGYDEVRFSGYTLIDEVANPVPEPGTFALMGLGLGVAFLARRKRNSVRTE